MSTEQLPEGLQLAVKLLAQIGDDESDRAIAAVHAVMDMGQPSELPEGLNIAVEAIGEYVESVVTCHRHPVTGELAPHAEIDQRHGAAAIDAIRAERAQRLTLQHHAADLAQRIALMDELLCSMQADAVEYLRPDGGHDAAWLVGRMLRYLDGPEQRAAQGDAS